MINEQFHARFFQLYKLCCETWVKVALRSSPWTLNTGLSSLVEHHYATKIHTNNSTCKKLLGVQNPKRSSSNHCATLE